MTTGVSPRPLLWLMLGCLAVTFALNANTFFGEWVYDDVPVIVQNPDIQSFADFLKNNRPGRPLRELSLMLDRTVFGMQPAGWHVQQLLWHALNGFLVGMLALRLRMGRGAAFVAALLFLIHPLQVEVVAQLSHRKDSLALALALLALLVWMRTCAAESARRRLLLGMASAGLFVLGCLAKESVVVLPAVFGIYEQLFLPRQQRILTGSLWPGSTIAALGVVAGAAWYLFMGGRERVLTEAGYLLMKSSYFDPVNEWIWLLILLKSWLFMFVRLLWPLDLAIEYVYPLPGGWLDPWVITTLVLIAVAAAVVFFCWRRAPLMAFALLWAGVLWLPVANLWPTAYLAADRYCYAPMVGMALLAGQGAGALLPSRRNLVLSVSTVVLLACAFLTWRQNAVWRSNPALWEQAYRVSPQSVAALNNHGVYLFRQGRSREGLALIEQAARNPYYFEANQNAAMIYQRMGLQDRAAYYLKRAGDPHAGNRFTRY